MASTEPSKIVSSCIRFFAGAAAGSFLVLLPLLYSEIGSWHEITSVQWGLIVCVLISCGLISVKLGSAFIDAVMNGFGHGGF